MSRTLRTTVVRSGSVEGGALWLRVSDAGPGIPTQDRARIFEKYERLDHAASGVGLGLTIARAAVEAQTATCLSRTARLAARVLRSRSRRGLCPLLEMGPNSPLAARAWRLLPLIVGDERASHAVNPSTFD
ncbi:MAG: hypothetical protein JOZ87_17260 [Chloroflexi bacterium]|nr:hypothetical protein [Chloroflexota bacterium]